MSVRFVTLWVALLSVGLLAAASAPNATELDARPRPKRQCRIEGPIEGPIRQRMIDALPEAEAELWLDGRAIAGDCCQSNADCVDVNACTNNLCVSGECQFPLVPDCCTGDARAECDDRNACTVDTCVNNLCRHSMSVDCCTSDSQCDDGNSCTRDSCVGNQCQYDPFFSLVCPAGELNCLCRRSDTGDVVDTADEALVDHLMSRQELQCRRVADQDAGMEERLRCCSTSADCNDGDACTSDTCSSAFQCISVFDADAPGCCRDASDCNDRNACTRDVCNTLTFRCSNPVIAGCCTDSAACEDGNPCTTDACVNNFCVQTQVSDCCTVSSECNDGNSCTRDICLSQTSNTCSYLPLLRIGIGEGGELEPIPRAETVNEHGARMTCCSVDADCDDGNSCTIDTCSTTSYTCMYAVPDNLDQLRDCCRTAEDCSPGSCQSATCSANNQCLYQDLDLNCCQADSDCNDGNACTTDVCGPDGRCQQTLAADCCVSADQCDDSNPCTVDRCVGNACVYGPQISRCNAGDSACECEILNPRSFLPARALLTEAETQAAAMHADDADVPRATICAVRGLEAQPAPTPTPTVGRCCTVDSDCSDGNACTVDYCDPETFTCRSRLNGGGSRCCESAADCDDGNSCTTGSCVSSQCVYASVANCCQTAADCDDGNSCTVDSCDTATGSCSSVQTQRNCCASDADCSDGNLCTTDSCVDQTCQYAPSLSSGGLCRVDSTDPECRCLLRSDDSVEEWTGGQLPPGVDERQLECARRVPVMVTACCATSTDCNDFNSCTVDRCNTETFQCEYTFSSLLDGCCQDGTLVEEAIMCDDGNACTADSCLGGACQHIQQDGCCTNSADCADDNPCTTNTCFMFNSNFGICQVSMNERCCTANEDCNDNNGCTRDSCVNGECQYAPLLQVQCDSRLQSDCLCLSRTRDATENENGDEDERQVVIEPERICARTSVDRSTGERSICCTNNRDCSDGNPCTTDICSQKTFTCVFRYNVNTDLAMCCQSNRDCADGNPCTTEQCDTATSQCVYQQQAPSECCNSDSDCRSGDACTRGSCVDNKCVFQVQRDCCTSAADCDDNNACTTNLCVLGRCQFGPLLDPCLAGDSRCVCARMDTGAYVHTADEQRDLEERLVPIQCARTETDPVTRQASVCCTTNADCSDMDPCTVDSCDMTTYRCRFTFAPGKTGCCQSAADCVAPNRCATATCTSGRCLYAMQANCCLSDRQCDDQNDCTIDRCNLRNNTCTHASLDSCCTQNSDCDDGNACTNDRCIDSVCFNSPTGVTEPCRTGDVNCLCARDERALVAVDGIDRIELPCRRSHVDLERGVTATCCQADADCDDGDRCTVDHCNRLTGQCYYGRDSTLTNCCQTTADCDDGNPCTSERCDAGGCLSFRIRNCCRQDADCQDDDPCTTNRCNTVDNRCQVRQVAGCCRSSADCNDNNACTSDLCVLGRCQYAPLLVDICIAGSTDCTCQPQEPAAVRQVIAPGGEAANCRRLAPAPEHANTDAVVELEAARQLVAADSALYPELRSRCCRSDSDCNDLNPCTVDSCDTKFYRCRHTVSADNSAGCCVTSRDCNDDNPCTSDVCTSRNRCVNTVLSRGCCSTNADCVASDPCQRGICGSDSRCTYVHALNCCSENADCNDGNLCTRDRCVNSRCQYSAVFIRPTLYTEVELQTALQTQVRVRDVDARQVREIHSIAAVQSGGIESISAEAVPLDEATVLYRGCCTTDRECNDGNACTIDSCDTKTYRCRYVRSTSAAGCCTSDRDCAVDDLCVRSYCASDGMCRVVQLKGCCQADADCDDSNNCTSDVCRDGTCVHRETKDCCSTNSDCDDGNLCTRDVCLQGRCTFVANLDPCLADDRCVCRRQLAVDEIGEPVRCLRRLSVINVNCCQSDSDCDDGNSCTTDSCDRAHFRCLHTFDADQDGVADQAGCCTTDADCDTKNPCSRAWCQAGRCVESRIDNCCLIDRDCDDGVRCTIDRCRDNRCVNIRTDACCKSAADCNDGNSCTIDRCVDNTCQYAPSLGSVCEPGSADCVCLQEAAARQDGAAPQQICTRSLTGLPSEAFERMLAEHDEATRKIGDPPMEPDDPSLVTDPPVRPVRDFYPPARPIADPFGQCCRDSSDCDDANACTRDVCNQVTFRCNHIASTSGTNCCTRNEDCDDKNPCTEDICHEGRCVQRYSRDCCVTARECDDNDPCTLDRCVEGKCRRASIDGCCHSDIDCNDGNACTRDRCIDNKCRYQPPFEVCRVGDPECRCSRAINVADIELADALTPAKPICKRLSIIPGPNGDDGTQCCTHDSDCDDGNSCTNDRCSTRTFRCTHTFISAQAGAALAVACCDQDSDCDDGNRCTTDTCSNGLCRSALVRDCCRSDIECADSNPCTRDVCGNDGRCQHFTSLNCCNTHSECDDGLRCTYDLCINNRCQYSPFRRIIANPLPIECQLGDVECLCVRSDTGAEYTVEHDKRAVERPPLQCRRQVAIRPPVDDLPANCCSTDDECAAPRPCMAGRCSPKTFTCEYYSLALTVDGTDIPACCTANSDCDDDNTCTNDFCVNQRCRFQKIDGCCQSDRQCDDHDACTKDACTNGRCVHVVTSRDCCNTDRECQDFNTCTVGHCVSNRCVYRPSLGLPTDPTDCIPGVDGVNVCYPVRDSIDVVEQRRSSGDGVDELIAPHQRAMLYADMEALEETRIGLTRLNVTAILPQYIGQCCRTNDDCPTTSACTVGACNTRTWRCMYRFDAAASPGCCTADSDCDDGDDCTTDACVSGRCRATKVETCCHNGLDCNDGDVCTRDVCVEGQCKHATLLGCCNTSLDCNDGNRCTQDLCINHRCTFRPVFALVSECRSISDANGDVIDRICQVDPVDAQAPPTTRPPVLGGCCSTDADCDDGNRCTKDVCDPKTFQCRWLSSDATDCCTASRDCNDDNECTADACVNSRCFNSAIRGCCRFDKECGDGDACTVDQCRDGQCTHSVLFKDCCRTDADCSDRNQCTIDSCVNNRCVHRPVFSVFEPCDPTVDRLCRLERCTREVDVERAVEEVQCRRQVRPVDSTELTAIEAELADQYDEVTLSRRCCAMDSHCQSADPCVTGRCNKATWQCTYSRSTGANCCQQDSDCQVNVRLTPCATYSCQAGRCVYAELADCCYTDGQCDDGRACTKDFCDTERNQCAHSRVPNCCTSDDQCDDGNECTPDRCVRNRCTHSIVAVPITGTIETQLCLNKIPQLMERVINEADSRPVCAGFSYIRDVADEAEHLSERLSIIPPPSGPCCRADSECSDGNPCTEDWCNRFTMRCEHAGSAEADGCCQSDKDCDDDNACTSDTCVNMTAGGRCLNVFQRGCCRADADCDDGDRCTHDACVENRCMHRSQPVDLCCNVDADCNDGEMCTVDRCVSGRCTHTAVWGELVGHEEHVCSRGECLCYRQEEPAQEAQIGSAVQRPVICRRASGDDDELAVARAISEAEELTVLARKCCRSDADCESRNDRANCRRGRCNLRNFQCEYTAIVDAVNCCVADADCADENPCTVDTCQDGRCVQRLVSDNCCFNDKQCDDGNACTRDHCAITRVRGYGQCVYSKLESCCESNADCYDGNSCTVDWCQNNQCVFYPAFGNIGCSIGDYDCVCSAELARQTGAELRPQCARRSAAVADELSARRLLPVDQLQCCATDSDCALDTTLPGTSCAEAYCTKQFRCAVRYRSDVTGCCASNDDCDDGDRCTVDRCVSSVCQNRRLLSCCTKDEQCDDGDACTVDICNREAGRCQHKDLGGSCCNTAADCNDSLACTLDRCVDNFCQHSVRLVRSFELPVLEAVPLEDREQLAEAQISKRPPVAIIGQAEAVPLPVVDVLPMPGCCRVDSDCEREVVGTELVLNQCWKATCDPNSHTCVRTPSGADGCCTASADCDDGNPCTIESCSGGLCVGLGRRSDCCKTDRDCDDNDPCTQDVCRNNRCLQERTADCCMANSDCDDGQQCTHDVCLNNSCRFLPAFGRPVRAQAEVEAGVGVGAAAARQQSIALPAECCSEDKDCDDSNACTRDWCCAEFRCVHENIGEDGNCCQTDADCATGMPLLDECVTYVCSDGRCQKRAVGRPAGAMEALDGMCCSVARDCDDGQACTMDYCVEGRCAYEFAGGLDCDIEIVRPPLVVGGSAGGTGGPATGGGNTSSGGQGASTGGGSGAGSAAAGPTADADTGTTGSAANGDGDEGGSDTGKAVGFAVLGIAGAAVLGAAAVAWMRRGKPGLNSGAEEHQYSDANEMASFREDSLAGADNPTYKQADGFSDGTNPYAK